MTLLFTGYTQDQVTAALRKITPTISDTRASDIYIGRIYPTLDYYLKIMQVLANEKAGNP